VQGNGLNKCPKTVSASRAPAPDPTPWYVVLLFGLPDLAQRQQRAVCHLAAVFDTVQFVLIRRREPGLSQQIEALYQ